MYISHISPGFSREGSTRSTTNPATRQRTGTEEELDNIDMAINRYQKAAEEEQVSSPESEGSRSTQHRSDPPENCHLAIFLKKMKYFGIFFEKMSSFWQFFDSQMAIFRRVRSVLH